VTTATTLLRGRAACAQNKALMEDPQAQAAVQKAVVEALKEAGGNVAGAIRLIAKDLLSEKPESDHASNKEKRNVKPATKHNALRFADKLLRRFSTNHFSAHTHHRGSGHSTFPTSQNTAPNMDTFRPQQSSRHGEGYLLPSRNTGVAHLPSYRCLSQGLSRSGK